MIKLPDVVLFDWDNTLVDSWEKLHECISHVLEHFETPLWTLEEVKAKMHKSLKDYFPELFGERWQEASEVFYKKYVEHSSHHAMKALEGAENLLKELKDLGIKIGVVSNKNGNILRTEVKKIGWSHYFDVLVGSTDAAKDKPFAEPVLFALDKISHDKNSHVWFVGDTIVDIDCARISGCHPIFYGEDAEFLKEKNYNFSHVKNHNELLNLFNKYK